MIENWLVLASAVAAKARKAPVARTAARATVRTDGRERRVTDPPPVGIGFEVGTLEGSASCGAQPVLERFVASFGVDGLSASLAGRRARDPRPDSSSRRRGMAPLRAARTGRR